jgi:CBS domain-containing protein/anti-sigma regulatory factor (Ser/Thr protein kinase)
MNKEQELSGRAGRVVTDQNAQDITRVEELAYDLLVAEVMTREVKTTNPDMRMADLLELLRNGRISGAPVVQEQELVGLVSLEDLIRSMVAMDINAPISKYMARDVIAVHEYDKVIEAIQTFSKQRVGRLPVLDKEERLVGMITKGDITRGVLMALQKDYQAEEIRRYRASHLFEDIHSDRTTLVLRYHIEAHDFTQGGNASSNIKRALLRLGASPQLARRCGIAIYEAETNLIIHTTHGGMIRVEIEPHRILMQAIDEGPGIASVELALQPGYTTASEEIRELGFGAGMGLGNILRCVDKMSLESSREKGTRLEMKIYLRPEDHFREAGYFDGEKIDESARNH